jgi:hypothetical protein
MKLWIIASCIAATACQSNELETSNVEQAIEDCPKGGNYPYAKLPQMPYWNASMQTPTAAPGQLYMDYADTRKSGQHLAFIADPGKGQLVWGVIVKAQDLPAYRATLSGHEPRIGDCCRPPPPPVGGGDDWLAAFTLESSLIFIEANERAIANTGDPY